MTVPGCFRGWWVSVSAVAMMVVGSEIFLQYSTRPMVKMSGVVVSFFGVLLLGWSRWSRRDILIKLTSLFLFCFYFLGATVRYPGLLKEPRPYRAVDLLIFGMKIFLCGAIGTLAVGMVRWILLRSNTTAGATSKPPGSAGR